MNAPYPNPFEQPPQIAAYNDQVAPDDVPSDQLVPKTAWDLVCDRPTLRPYLIRGMLRTGEVMNLVGAPKSRKSWLILMLLLCFVGRRMWLGFQLAGGKVLLLDNELHEETLAHRIPMVASALGITRDEYGDNLHVVSLRGRAMDLNRLDTFMRSLQPGEYQLIVLDAIYRFFWEGFDENSNSDWTQLMNRLDQWAQMLQCGIVIIHHSSKGVQGGKSVTDTGAGAGAQSRAPDVHAVIREHEQPDCAVFQAVVRSSEPLPPLCLHWHSPCWQVDATLDPAQLKRDPSRGGRPKGPKAEKPAELLPWSVDAFVERFVAEQPKPVEFIVARAVHHVEKEFQTLPERQVRQILTLAEGEGRIFRHKIPNTRVVHYSLKAQSELFECANKKHTRTPRTPRKARALSARSSGN